MTTGRTINSLFPFSNLNNGELRDTLESTDRIIQRKLTDQNFTNFIKKHSLISNILDKPFGYYTSEDFAKLTEPSIKKQSTLFHLNIRSLDKHLGKLIALSETMLNPEFICLSEIGRKNIENREAQLQKMGLSMKFEKPSKVRGGVAIIHSTDQILEERTDLKIKKPKNTNILDHENIWYETDIKGIGKTIIGVIYKHPNSTIAGLKQFKNDLNSILVKINNENKNCIIAGDINLDALNIKKTNNKEFFEMIMDSNFIPLVTLPTRIQDESCTTIDHIFINQKLISNSSKRLAGNIYSDISDHLPNFLTLGHTKTYKINNSRPYVRIFGEKNHKKFEKAMEETNWESLYQATEPETAIGIFKATYNKVFNESFPLKKLSRARAKDKKWVNPKLRKLINKKEDTYRKLLNNPTSDTIKKKYAKIRNTVNSQTEAAEIKYYQELMNEEKKSMRNLWDVAGAIINPQKMKKSSHIKSLKHKGETITNSGKMADIFNKYFSSIGKDLAEKIKVKNNAHKKYLKNRLQPSIELTEVTSEEILKILNSLKTNKAAGDDGIRPGMLKKCATTLMDPLTHIMNLSFKKGIVPDCLKLAKVMPVYKKEDKTVTGNYRPVALLSILDKIMEKLMYSRIIKFLNNHKILYKYQFGFRKQHSTEQAVIEIIDNIIEELEKGSLVAGIFLDLSKAFDVVDHQILLGKLEHYGIRGTCLEWFRSYLENRKQYTIVNGTKSSAERVEYGVPQGSVLGPLLFLIYTNDIAESTKDYKLRLFADDSNIFVVAKDPTTLKENMIKAVTNICEWFRVNKLTVNMSKTQFTIFTKPNKTIPGTLNSMKVMDTLVERVDSAKYLGIYIDGNLSWKKHIEELEGKLSKTIQAFKIVSRYINNNQKKACYYAYFYSRINYGIELYSQCTSKLLKRIQVKQNNALKVLYKRDYFTPTNELHKDMDLLKVKDIANQKILKFVHKQQKGDTPEAFSNYFPAVNTIHEVNTRQKENLLVPRGSIFAKKSMKYRGPVLWNNVNTDIQENESSKTFAKQIKKVILDSY